MCWSPVGGSWGHALFCWETAGSPASRSPLSLCTFGLGSWAVCVKDLPGDQVAEKNCLGNCFPDHYHDRLERSKTDQLDETPSSFGLLKASKLGFKRRQVSQNSPNWPVQSAARNTAHYSKRDSFSNLEYSRWECAISKYPTKKCETHLRSTSLNRNLQSYVQAE